MPGERAPMLRKLHSTIQEEEDDDDTDIHEDNENHRKRTPPHGTFSPKMKTLPVPTTTTTYTRRLLPTIPASPRSTSSSIDSQHLFMYTNHFPHLFTEDKLRDMRKIGLLSEGRSRFGDVSKYIENETIRLWTGCLRKENTDNWQAGQKLALCHEMEDMTNLVHPRIAKFRGYYIGSKMIATFRDYSPMGTVEDEFRRNGRILAKKVLNYAKDLLEALQYCHNRQPRILHRNIKASNLLLRTDGHILLCDFGIENLDQQKSEDDSNEEMNERKISTSSLSQSPKISPISQIPSTSEFSHFRRTILATAPEILERIFDESAYTEAADIWAAGCVLVEMMTTKPPLADSFYHLDDLELHQELISLSSSNKLDYSLKNLLGERFGENRDLESLLESMLQLNEGNRSSAAQLLLGSMFNESIEVRIPVPSSPLSTRSSKTPSFKIKIPTDEEISDSLDHKDQEEADRKSLKPEDLRETKAKKEKWSNRSAVSLINKYLRNIIETECGKMMRWYGSRCLLFLSLLIKWMGVVLISALSLAFVAYLVFQAIFLIYKAIGIVCQCKLNEGFIVLIALILLPILILLTTLCCNNSIEKYKQAKADGSLEKCSYVKRAPEDDIILCGILVLQGTKGRSKKSSSLSLAKRKNADSTQQDPGSINQAIRLQSGFAMGVSKLA